MSKGYEEDRPLISIIVPVYNIIEYLSRCVHSIMKQTYRNLEIILVDDGSTDGTGVLCDRLAAEDGRIIVFHKKNGGSSSARNFGIVKSHGEYLGFIDSDDYIEPDMYETLFEGLKKYGAKCAQTGRDEIDEKGDLLANICEPPKEETVIRQENFLRELLMHRGDCSFCTKLIARDIFFDDEGSEKTDKGFTGEDSGVCDKTGSIEANDGPDTDYVFFPVGVLNEDFHILVKKLEKIGDIISLPGQKYHVFYRIGSNSRKESRREFSRVYADNVDNADMVRNLVKERYPDNKELQKIAFRFGVFQRIDYLLHIPVEQMNGEGQYSDIVGWMRKNYFRALFNPYLTGKNKMYHTLFAIAPKTVRKIHRKIRKLQ